jgi:hypothetical protein
MQNYGNIYEGNYVQLFGHNQRRIWENRKGNKPKNRKRVHKSLRSMFFGKKEVLKEIKTTTIPESRKTIYSIRQRILDLFTMDISLT